MGSSTNSGTVFDIRQIRRLVELMNEHELNEIDLRQAEMRIRIRRGAEPVIYDTRSAAPAPPPVAAAQQTTAPAAPPAEDSKLHVIKSPMVGTFYSAPKPDQPPFVKVGDDVGPETTICIIEAMKVFNEIPAEVSGKIAAVLVDNGDAVEYDQPLFKVDTGKGS